eukprot:TRINITY_DN27870_c0_g2_i1.p2 TRINITY_DN27870_c0_g2~~TRINITY_DN27870_c0_g2_i1.p2  ORF type:complete len:120 (+),score=33.80 TRINITY_DN27870_c0_g2_i1:150-509(+)
MIRAVEAQFAQIAHKIDSVDEKKDCGDYMAEVDDVPASCNAVEASSVVADDEFMEKHSGEDTGGTYAAGQNGNDFMEDDAGGQNANAPLFDKCLMQQMLREAENVNAMIKRVAWRRPAE